MNQRIHLEPIGFVRKNKNKVWITIDPRYKNGLMGLESFSHIYVLYWLHKNDTPIRRRTLQVHPKHNPKNPLTGVFATHAPVRPNPIALSICKILSIGKNRIFVDGIDALNNSPVLDLKCYNPDGGAETNVTVPQWAISTEAY